jgi:hypothetical protein
LEGLLDTQAGRAYAVGNVDDARELFKLPEQVLGDERVIAAEEGSRRVHCQHDGSENKGKLDEEKTAYHCGHQDMSIT